jgi:hypothetical protein
MAFATWNAAAQSVPLYLGTTNSTVDEFGATLRGTGPAAPYFGFTYVTGEVVQILQGDTGIFPPSTDGTPSTNNTLLAVIAVGEGVDPSLGPVGMFGGSLVHRPSGTIFARVFNRSSLSASSFYGDSQLFVVPTTNYDVFIPSIQQTINPLDSNDDDNDGLHNSWEKSLQSNADNPDTDGDGMADGLEFRAGTDLNDASSLLRIIALRPTPGNDLSVTWNSVSGKQYRIEYSSQNLCNNMVYTNASDVISATGSVSSTTISGGLQLGGGSYCVRLVAP